MKVILCVSRLTIVLAYVAIVLALFCKANLHPRFDPSTREVYNQVKDPGITVLIRFYLLDTHDDCHKSEVAQHMFSLISQSLKRVGCKKIMVDFKRIENEKSVEYVHKNSRCYRQFFRHRLKDFEFVDEVSTSAPAGTIDAMITLSHSALLPFPSSLARINVAAYVDLNSHTSVQLSSKEDVDKYLHAFNQYDHILVANTQEYGYIQKIISSCSNASFEYYMNTNNPHNFLPAISKLNSPTDNIFTPAAMRIGHKSYRLKNLEARHTSLAREDIRIAAYIGLFGHNYKSQLLCDSSDTSTSLRESSFVGLGVMDVLQAFKEIEQAESSFLGNNIGDPCPFSARLYLFGSFEAGVSEAIYIKSILKEFTYMGVLECQLSLIDIRNKTYVRDVLLQSSVLWMPYLQAPHLCNYGSIDSTTGIGRSKLILSNHSVIPSRGLSSLLHLQAYQASMLVRAAMATGCVPVVLTALPSHAITDKLHMENETNGFILSSDYLSQFPSSIDALKAFTLYVRRSVSQEKVLNIQKANANVALSITMDSVMDQLESIISGEIIDSTPRDFIKAHLPVLRQRALKLAALPRSHANWRGNLTQHNDYSGNLAVIIEPRPHRYLEYCVRNTIEHLDASWGLRVYHSRSRGDLGNEDYVKYVLKDIANVDYLALPEFWSYNEFLRSPNLWKSLRDVADKVLIFQTDSLMLRYDINSFLQYDYIGAPWHMNKKASSYRWLEPFQRGTKTYFKEGVGNGGFSLRSTDVMMQICEWYRGRKNIRANEDVFFIGKFEKFERGKLVLPSRTMAYSFAMEVPCDDIDIRYLNSTIVLAQNRSEPKVVHVPMAIHSSWAYVEPAYTKALLEISIRHRSESFVAMN